MSLLAKASVWYKNHARERNILFIFLTLLWNFFSCGILSVWQTMLNVLSLTITASCGEYKNDLRLCSTVNTESANVFSLWATAGAVNQKAIQLKMCARPNFTLACGGDCVTHWQELNFTISATTSVRLGNLIHPKGASYPFGLSRYFCLENVSLSLCGTRAQLADRPRCQCGRLAE